MEITVTNLTLEDVSKAIRLELDSFFTEHSVDERKAEEDEIGGISLAMEVTGLAKPTIYTLCSRREIPHSKKRKRLYFSRKDLLDWISNGKRKTQAEIATEAQNYNKKETRVKTAIND